MSEYCICIERDCIQSDLHTIPDVLAAAATSYGPAEAVADGGTRLSFEQLWSDARTAAAGLIEAGIERGDRVGTGAPNSAAWIVASYAVYGAGAVLVPLNTRYRAAEAAHIVRTAGVTAMVTVTDFMGNDFAGLLATEVTRAERPRLIIIGGPEPEGALPWSRVLDSGAAAGTDRVEERRAALSGDSLSDIVFTSGTTGAPKGAMLAHGASVRTYEAWSDCVGLRAGDRYLCVYPFFHTAGLKSGVLACAIRGATVLPHAVFDVAEVMAKVSAERVTMLPGPPSVFQSILAHPDLPLFDLSSLRLSVTGAAVVPVQVVERMRSELHFERVVTGYGLTETTGTVTMCRHDDPPEVIARTVGRPLPGVELRMVDDAGRDVPAGNPGEILVRGFNVMKGYFADPAATAAVIDEDGWLFTGDIGVIDPPGNLRITDRKKDMFIVGGFNAYPAEIEKVMADHPDIALAAVIGVPDERLGEVGHAYVVVRPGSQLREEGVISWCRERMANYKVPRRIHVVDELPLTPSGKVMKHVLRRRGAMVESRPDPGS